MLIFASFKKLGPRIAVMHRRAKCSEFFFLSGNKREQKIIKMAKYKFEECNDIKKWDAFVDESPQGTIFSNTKLISCVSGYCDYWGFLAG